MVAKLNNTCYIWYINQQNINKGGTYYGNE